MENKPNMYRVTYLVMEGDNYAGGWGERNQDIQHLSQLVRFNKIKSVIPVFSEFGEPLSDEVINRAIEAQKIALEKERLVSRVEYAKYELTIAQQALTPPAKEDES